MKKFDYTKWVTDHKNGKPLFETEDDKKIRSKKSNLIIEQDKDCNCEKCKCGTKCECTCCNC